MELRFDDRSRRARVAGVTVVIITMVMVARGAVAGDGVAAGSVATGVAPTGLRSGASRIRVATGVAPTGQAHAGSAPVGATPVATNAGTAPDRSPVGATPVATKPTTPPNHATTPEITVTATLRDTTPLAQLPASVALLDADTLATAVVQHVEEAIHLVPNLNWSGEGARARYLQVRGSGEIEQYEGAPNPSVGFIVDDIDFSGIGGIATAFDIDRVEVLRGPQGTRYGANALAGLIYARSADPTTTPELAVEALAGGDGARGLGMTAAGPLAGEALAARLAVQQYVADGVRDNAWLGRDDTDDRDELTARGKLRWRPASGWQVDLTALLVALDDGYDAWSLDGGFTTQSDSPGDDDQRTVAGALRLTAPLGTGAELVSITGVADSDILFAFDADWGNAALWAPDVYAFTQRTDRERRTVNQELRLVSTAGGRIDWVAGLYALRLAEDNRVHDAGLLDPDDANCPPPPDPDAGWCLPFAVDRTVTSDYDATSLAVFGELGIPLGAATRLTLGLRGERRDADYADRLVDPLTPASAANRFAPTDRLWGGEIALTQELGAATTGWLRVARGYKAGGFNPGLARVDFDDTDLAVSRDQVQFGPEALWNTEAGLRHAAGPAWLGASAFWQRREDMQVRVPLQLRLGDPNTFVFVTDNAESAGVLGLEAEGGWQVTDALALRASAGWLHTRLERFAAEPAFEGRDFPHAPRTSFAVGGDWTGPHGWFARLDVTGRGSFLFDYDTSTGADRKADASQLVNLRLGRRLGAWEVALWARNLLDEHYAVRGFYFGNEPPAFAPTRYIRHGDPRQIGVTLRWRR